MHAPIQGTAQAQQVTHDTSHDTADSQSVMRAQIFSNVEAQTLNVDEIFSIVDAPKPHAWGFDRHAWGPKPHRSLHRHRFRQIARLVHVRALGARRVIRQQLQRHHVQDGAQRAIVLRHADHMDAGLGLDV
jgi:hypothetical protein